MLEVFQKVLFWNYFNLMFVSMVQSHRCILRLVVGPHSTQSISYPKEYSLETSTPEGPQHTGPAPWWRMFHLFTLLHFHLLHTATSLPKIHRLLKLLQLNLSDTITHAHSITFPHVLAVIQSIFFRNYFA